MHLQEAINLVRAQFTAEARAQTAQPEPQAREIRRAYNEAGGTHPAMLAVAHHIWADELVKQNILRAQQAQAAAGAGHAGTTADPGA